MMWKVWKEAGGVLFNLRRPDMKHSRFGNHVTKRPLCGRLHWTVQPPASWKGRRRCCVACKLALSPWQNPAGTVEQASPVQHATSVSSAFVFKLDCRTDSPSLIPGA